MIRGSVHGCCPRERESSLRVPRFALCLCWETSGAHVAACARGWAGHGFAAEEGFFLVASREVRSYLFSSRNSLAPGI